MLSVSIASVGMYTCIRVSNESTRVNVNQRTYI